MTSDTKPKEKGIRIPDWNIERDGSHRFVLTGPEGVKYVVHNDFMERVLFGFIEALYKNLDAREGSTLR